MNKRIIVIAATFLFSIPYFANATWYESQVVEVSARSQGGVDALYIRTESNPNPAECPGSWAGARWSSDGLSLNLASSIALTAKIAEKTVRFNIDDSSCDVSGLPKMNWIQMKD